MRWGCRPPGGWRRAAPAASSCSEGARPPTLRDRVWRSSRRAAARLSRCRETWPRPRTSSVSWPAIAGGARPLRGVLHAAGVLETSSLDDLDAAMLARVTRAKTAGGLLLHERTRDLGLDFFVLFSSISSVWGDARPRRLRRRQSFPRRAGRAAPRARAARPQHQLGTVERGRTVGRRTGTGAREARPPADRRRAGAGGARTLPRRRRRPYRRRAHRLETFLPLMETVGQDLWLSAAGAGRGCARARSRRGRADESVGGALGPQARSGDRDRAAGDGRRHHGQSAGVASRSRARVLRHGLRLDDGGRAAQPAGEANRPSAARDAGVRSPDDPAARRPSRGAGRGARGRGAGCGAGRQCSTHAWRRASTEIAIVGMACRFPGAADPEALWQLLADGRDAVTEMPRGAPPARSAWPPVPSTRAVPRGGFLDDVDRFDARFFGISAREARAIDPQQRLLLEVALGGARGRRPCARPRSRAARTGVFVGIATSDYAQLLRIAGGRAAGIDAVRRARQRAQAPRPAASPTCFGLQRPERWPSTPRARRRWSRCTSPARACATASATSRSPAAST